jgi:hypothetical protein
MSAQASATDREGAGEHSVQPAGGQAMLDRSRTEADGSELTPGHNAVLPVGERRDGEIRRSNLSIRRSNLS